MKILKNIFNILSSQSLLIWLISGWLLYYTTLAIWMDQAFAYFVEQLQESLLIKLPFVLFLVCGYLNLIKSLKVKFRSDKIGFAAWLMLASGILLFFTGFFVSINFRQFDSRLAGEGDRIRLPWSNQMYVITKLETGLKDKFMLSDTSGVLEYEPRITITDDSSGTYTIGAYPPIKIKGTYFHILDFGLAPGIKLYVKGRLLKQGYMALRLLPPGRSDYFEIPPYPYRFLISLRPEPSDHSLQHQAPVFNLRNPRYYLRIFKGENIVAESGSDDLLTFDSLSLDYFKPTYWVLLEASRDYGIPLIRLGILLIASGILAYIAWAIFRGSTSN